MKNLMRSSSVFALACLCSLPADALCQSRIPGQGAVTLDNISTAVADLARKVRPSVVQIRTVGYGSSEGQ